MYNWKIKLRGGQRTGQRRISIPVHKDILRFLLQQNRFNPLQHLPCLCPVRTGPDREIVIRRRYSSC